MFGFRNILSHVVDGLFIIHVLRPDHTFCNAAFVLGCRKILKIFKMLRNNWLDLHTDICTGQTGLISVGLVQ